MADVANNMLIKMELGENQMRKFDQVLKLHNDRVSKVKDDANKVRNEREEFDKELMFSQRLWEFVHVMVYYHRWHENLKAIRPDELVLRKFSTSELEKLIDKSYTFEKEDDIIEYSFEVNGGKYTLFINKVFVRQDRSEKWEPIYYYPVFIYENNERLVYEAKLFYDPEDEYGYDIYDHHCLEAFKPGEWTKFLLDKIFAIRAEEEQSRNELREKMNKDTEKRNREKFVD